MIAHVLSNLHHVGGGVPVALLLQWPSSLATPTVKAPPWPDTDDFVEGYKLSAL